MRRLRSELALLVAALIALLAPGLTVFACATDAPDATPEARPPDAAADGRAASDAGQATPDATVDAPADADVEPLERRARFVLLGDFGFDDANELAVANLVKAWGPDFIVTLGDNSYPESTPATIDETIGKYYGDFIHPYTGKYGAGASEPRFFACLGNHDWQSGSVKAHEDYFELPGNERYWAVQKGPVQFFCVDSDTREPDGTTPTSIQGRWLEAQLAAAKDPFRIVVVHHPPHSSGQHGSQAYMQWPFQAWGASAVYAGHDHGYERFDLGAGTIPFVVQGLGGADLRPFATTRSGSVVRYADKHGATFVEAGERYAVFAAITVGLDRIDEHVLASGEEAARPTETLLAAGSTFRYLDTGAPPPGWSLPGFDASAWKSGAAPLGYGQGDEQTTIAKGLAHYFVAPFTVADPSALHHAVVWLRRDDGAAVHVNGVEVGRTNLPAGPLDAQSLAREIVGYTAESAWIPVVVPRSVLRAGDNAVAVELHQASAQSSDAVLDVRVEGKR